MSQDHGGDSEVGTGAVGRRILRRRLASLAAARHQAPRVLASSVVVLLVTTVMVLTVEGAASVAVTLRGESGPVPLERAHTDFDRDLGWINSRSVRLDDLYGQGRYLE